MGQGTHDIFGDAADAQPATLGSYGQPPRGYRLPDATRLGPVRLQVASIVRSLAFYEGVLGMRTVMRDESRAVLTAQDADSPLVELHELAGARPMTARGRLGLFHFAILLPNRESLGRFVRHLAEIGARPGAADHLVSEAFYLNDPDGLGIEVYADRPRSSWRQVEGELMMATDPVDMDGLLEAAGDAPWQGMPSGTMIGHVHLHVGDIARASDFFSEALGFDRTVWHYPGALFFGAGGYHHHLGTNTWAGSDAAPPTERDARLLEWTIELPNAGDLIAVAESLARTGHAAEVQEGDARAAEMGGEAFHASQAHGGITHATEVVTRDPWGTRIRLVTGSPGRRGV